MTKWMQFIARTTFVVIVKMMVTTVPSMMRLVIKLTEMIEKIVMMVMLQSDYHNNEDADVDDDE